jgi:hypothetical protein
MAMADFLDSMAAEQYLTHRYDPPEGLSPHERGVSDYLANQSAVLLDDEPFVADWEAWLNDPSGSPFPDEAKDILLSGSVRAWITHSPAGRLPVIYTSCREDFVRLSAGLYRGEPQELPPASVNAFTITSKLPKIEGHRFIILHKAGYSSISSDTIGVSEGEWLEKSMKLRLHHECCHYFTLRVLGGMRNHALDEIIADCVGQLAAFGIFSASLQRLFFGLLDVGFEPGGRFGYYIKKLSKGAMREVCESVNKALLRLEKFLAENQAATVEQNRASLIIKLASAGIIGMEELS